MGFLSRMLVPRTVRRAVHPVGAVKRAVTPAPIKKARRALNPINNAVYGLERSLTTKTRSRGKAPAFNQGSCQINHRTPQVAAKCRNR